MADLEADQFGIEPDFTRMRSVGPSVVADVVDFIGKTKDLAIHRGQAVMRREYDLVGDPKSSPAVERLGGLVAGFVEEHPLNIAGIVRYRARLHGRQHEPQLLTEQQQERFEGMVGAVLLGGRVHLIENRGGIKHYTKPATGAVIFRRADRDFAMPEPLDHDIANWAFFAFDPLKGMPPRE